MNGPYLIHADFIYNRALFLVISVRQDISRFSGFRCEQNDATNDSSITQRPASLQPAGPWLHPLPSWLFCSCIVIAFILPKSLP